MILFMNQKLTKKKGGDFTIYLLIKHYLLTTRFHSFTDGKIPSVCDQKFVGDFFTDVITDGLCPSAFPSSVIPHFVAISVGKTKKPFADGFTDGICAPKKKDSRLKYTDGFLFRRYIVIYRRKLYIGKSVGECMKY